MFQDETSRKIFVGGLSYATQDEGLRDYFGQVSALGPILKTPGRYASVIDSFQFGEVIDCVVMKYKDSNKSRGFGK